MEKHVLILSDFVGYGNVAMATSRAVLTRMGCTVFCLPTALISNTWNFGSCATLDTTDYLRRSLANWEQLGFRLDAVLIGYIADEAQAEFLAEQCKRWHDQGIQVYLDPIFADNGKLYRGITEKQVSFLRTLLPRMDGVFPNATESCFLAGAKTPVQALSVLGQMTDGKIIITGAGNAVLLRDGQLEQTLPYTPVPGSFSGAGDAFTAVCLGGILAGNSLHDSAQTAMETTKIWIKRSQEEGWQGMGLPVERYF